MKYFFIMIMLVIVFIGMYSIYKIEQFDKKCIDAGGVKSIGLICLHPSSIVEVD